MKNKKYLVVLATLVMVIGLTGCGGDADTQTVSDSAAIVEETSGSEEMTEETAGDTVEDVTEDEVGSEYMDPAALEGSYADRTSGRATMEIIYNESQECYEVVIMWGNSAWETVRWTMTAYDKGNSDKLVYEDCSCDNLTYNDDSSFKSENVYQNGTGELIVNSDMTVRWYDDNKGEHVFEKM